MVTHREVLPWSYTTRRDVIHPLLSGSLQEVEHSASPEFFGQVFASRDDVEMQVRETRRFREHHHVRLWTTQDFDQCGGHPPQQLSERPGLRVTQLME